MEDKLELDPRILVKNLEITKLMQQVDSLKSQIVELKHTDDMLEMSELAKQQLTSEAKGWKANVNDLSQEIVRLTLKLEDYEK